MKKWEKALMAALDRRAERADYIDFNQFCREFDFSRFKDFRHIEEANRVIDCWLDKNPHFEWIGDDYEPLAWNSPVFVRTDCLWGTGEYTSGKAFALLKIGRVCKHRYACCQAEGYFERAFHIFRELAKTEKIYLLFSAECSKMIGDMKNEILDGDPEPFFRRAVKDYEAVMESIGDIHVRQLKEIDKPSGKYAVLRQTFRIERVDETLYHDFISIRNYAYYMLAEVCESIGDIFLDEKYSRSDSKDIRTIRCACKFFQRADECYEYIHKHIGIEKESTRIAAEHKWQHSLVLASYMQCAGILDDSELAESCFRKIDGLGELKEEYCVCMAEIYERSGKPEMKKYCCERALDNIDEMIKQYPVGVEEYEARLAFLAQERKKITSFLSKQI